MKTEIYQLNETEIGVHILIGSKQCGKTEFIKKNIKKAKWDNIFVFDIQHEYSEIPSNKKYAPENMTILQIRHHVLHLIKLNTEPDKNIYPNMKLNKSLLIIENPSMFLETNKDWNDFKELLNGQSAFITFTSISKAKKIFNNLKDFHIHLWQTFDANKELKSLKNIPNDKLSDYR